MRDIHRSSTTWLARRTGRGSAARPPHRSHRRRLTLEPLECRALLSLTTWTVNSLGDTGAGTGTSGDLRYVITQADKTTGDNTINFSVTGTITLNSVLPDLSNTTGLMDIEGPGAASLTVARSSAAPDFGDFTVDSGVTANLSGLTISGGVTASAGGGIDNAGSLTVTNSTIADNSAGGWDPVGGGGIYNAGTLSVTNSVVDNNSVTGAYYGPSGNGGGIYNAGILTVSDSTVDKNSGTSGSYGGGNGGGIYNTGTLTITNSAIADNSLSWPAYHTSLVDGGGIDNAGTLTVTNSTIDENSAEVYGGGICNLSQSAVTVVDTTIADNSADSGGGICSFSQATVSVTNSTIANNSVEGGGGGINNSGGALTVTGSSITNNSTEGSLGGGIFNSGTSTITDSTVDKNLDSWWGGEGGGISNGGRLIVVNSTVVYNTAVWGGGIQNTGTSLVTDSTIAYNSGTCYGSGCGGDGGGILDYGAMTVNNSLITLNNGGDVTGSLTGAFNLIGVADPGLDPNGLQNNGGPTQTIALMPGSPAIDAGSNALAVDPITGLPLTTDQRGIGFSRVVNGKVDVGTFEFQTTPTVTTHLSVTVQPPSTVLTSSAFGLIVSAEDSSGVVTPSFDGTVTVALLNNPGGATLGGGVSATAQNGVATFTGLTLDMIGTGYTLQVSSNGLTAAITNAIDVQASGSPTHYTVDLTGDTGMGSGSTGDLRYVIGQADVNTNPLGSLIQFDPTVFSSPQTITLNSALPDLGNTTGLIDIEGPGAAGVTVARSSAAGTPSFSVFTVGAAAKVDLAGLTIVGGSVSNSLGGGIYNTGTLTVSNSTVDHNTAGGYDGVGGGICNGSNGTLTVTNSTIADNSAGNGGGIYNDEGTLTVCNSTIAENSAGYIGGGLSGEGITTLDNTLIALNTTSAGTPDDIYIYGGVSSTSAYNLIGIGGSGGLVNGVNGNLVGIANPGLDPNGLQNNGGPTQTIALLPGSPAIDTGSNALAVDPTTGLPLITDQRGTGFARIVGKAVDIGAYEFGAGTYVVVTTQPPASVTAGTRFGLTVTAEDESGNVLSSFNGTVTVALDNNPGGATLGGTMSVTAQNGVATFSDLTLNKTGTGYTLLLSGSGLGGSTTAAINVTPAAASQLVVSSQPPDSVLAGSGFGLVVSAEDPFDNVDTNFGGSVAVALLSNPGGATLGGTLSETPTSGVATFSGLTLNVPGIGYTLSVSSHGLTAATTNPFNVTVPQLVVTAQPPASVLAGSGFGLTVTAEDSSGNVDTSLNGTVTVALTNNPGGATLGGTLSVTAINGVATFSGLTLNVPGIGYTLSVTSSGLTATTTSAFNVQTQIATVAVGWGTQTVALQTASDGLRLLPAGRNTDIPWLGIDRILITLNQAATLAAGDITVIGSSGTNYGPVTVSGSGTSYTITLSQAINAADRVTITIGNELIASFTRRLDVLPGDVNDDGVVNVQDMVAIRNQMLGLLGAVPTIFGDINGDGKVDINDYTAVRKLIGTTLPRIT